MWGDVFFWPFAAGWMALHIILALLIFAFVIWMVVDCAKRNFKNEGEKIIWIIVIVLATWVGAVIYYIAVRAMNPKGLSKR